jgi:hypothetical protein
MIDYLTPEVIKILLDMYPVDLNIDDSDICFCQDAECPQHETCRRWIGNYKGTNQYLSMTETFRKGGKCGYFQNLGNAKQKHVQHKTSKRTNPKMDCAK